jgi:outer membrane protein OmpA-like peptidoglycan-associated protein
MNKLGNFFSKGNRVIRAILLLFLMLPVFAVAQSRTKSAKLMDKARDAFMKRNYQEAIVTAKKVLVSDAENAGAALLLADVYHDLDSAESEIVYLEFARKRGSTTPLLLFRLGEASYKTGRYEEASSWLQRYLQHEPQGNIRARAEKLATHAAFAAGAVNHPRPYNPHNLGPFVNSREDEYWPSLTVDGSMLVFTRLLPPLQGSLKQEDFFVCRSDTSGWTTAEPLTTLNSPLNEGAQSISADGRLLFFTLCNHPGGFGSCDIWYSRYENGTWTKPANAGSKVNTGGWEGQPALSAFGNELYFSSNRPGGSGKKDLWKILLTGWSAEGLPLWGELNNLGDSINTVGDEISPFIHPNGKDFFFSSDEWPGFGGFDLFHSRIGPLAKPGKPTNLGYPLNSSGNEQGMVIDRTGIKAYLSSNRNPADGMDIYEFELDQELRPEAVSFFRGKIVSSNTGLPVRSSVHLDGVSANEQFSYRVMSDHKGEFLLTLPLNTALNISVNEPGYLFYSESFFLEGASSALQPVERVISLVPVEPGSTVDLYNIFFDTGSYEILPESEPELRTLLAFILKNPSLQIEIQGHTDNIGTADYNKTLSERRADAVRKYLSGKGSDPARITIKGYGMERPVASNDTEEGRSRNRRTTMMIVR